MSAVKEIANFPISKDAEQTEAFLKECFQLTEYGKLSGIISAAANEASSIEEAVQYALNAVCLFTGWEIGHLYLRQEDDFVPADVWFFSDKEKFSKIRKITMETVIKGNEGFLGRVFAEKNPIWLSAFYAEPNFLRKDIFLQSSIRFGVGLPIIVKQEAVAALEFFSVKIQPFDHHLMEILNQIGLELGRAFERFSAERNLQKEKTFLQLMEETAKTANLEKTPNDVLRVTVEKICFYAKWPVGHVYLVKQRFPDLSEILVSSGIWYLENSEKFKVFKEITEKMNFSSGVGLPGRVMADKKIHWLSDVQKDQNFPQAKIAKNLGVKSALAFPIFSSETKVAAVMEFLSDKEEEKDDKFLKIMADIGIQLGRVFERSELEKRLWKQINKLKKFQWITVGRELKMMELKQEIKKLKGE